LLEGRERRVRALARQIATLSTEDQAAIKRTAEILRQVIDGI
jgi:hypothetical protein